MTSEQIKALQKSIEERRQRFFENLDPASEKDPTNEALVSLSGTKSWDIIKGSLESMIYDLLQPEDLSSFATAEMYAISGEARRLGIIAIQSIIDSVEGAANAKKMQSLSGS